MAGLSDVLIINNLIISIARRINCLQLKFENGSPHIQLFQKLEISEVVLP